ncbi:ankyrin repeat-containing domain protein [Podospora didyma]|uniref:Ankyrin repeat-containing domain protein n=1 Tax=Podospora didyma TaxID=330526 RepID=A0AAE0U131_9PEZI|nr:ankyrin repeat-containing domain protein [Podospora didyma]
MDRHFSSLRGEVVEPLREELSLLRLELGQQRQLLEQRQETRPPISPIESATWASFIRHSVPPPRRISLCDINCHCRCHSANSYSSLGINSFASVLGSIMVAYTGKTTKACTSTSCRNYALVSQSSSLELRLVYHFPDWIMRAAVSVFFSSNLHGNPELNIRVFNIIASDGHTLAQSIFGYIHRGDVEGVRRALMEKRASVYDLYNGRSPLTESVLEYNLSLTRLLLHAGADPHQPEGSGGPNHTPVANAFRRYLLGAKELWELFPFSDFLEEIDAPALHMAVIGALNIDLEEAIQRPEYASQITMEMPHLRYPPLHIAALRSNVIDVELLLRAGADPNQKISRTSSTPLHIACYAGDYETVRSLLNAGAVVNERNDYGRTPLHIATSSLAGCDRRLLSLLVQHGADVNSRDIQRSQPLASAALQGNIEATSFLIEEGASVNNRDWEGDNVLFDAVQRNQHSSVELLLERGADFLNVNNHGWNFLHFLAANGDVKMMEIVTKRKMVGLSSTARDSTGKIPLQVLNERKVAPTTELRAAFNNLLESIDCANASIFDESEQGDGASTTSFEEFEDARETWEDA